MNPNSFYFSGDLWFFNVSAYSLTVWQEERLGESQTESLPCLANASYSIGLLLLLTSSFAFLDSYIGNSPQVLPISYDPDVVSIRLKMWTNYEKLETTLDC